MRSRVQGFTLLIDRLKDGSGSKTGIRVFSQILQKFVRKHTKIPIRTRPLDL